MPGPNEPSDYALDQILEPLVDEFLQLKQGTYLDSFRMQPGCSWKLGVHMTIHQGNPPIYQEELVHGELSQHIADLIAHIKMGRGAGVRSELNFCLYCHTHLSTLSVPAGYMWEGMPFVVIYIASNK